MNKLLLLLLASCVGDPSLAAQDQALSGSSACSVPGATPDDGLDDRPANSCASATAGN